MTVFDLSLPAKASPRAARFIAQPGLSQNRLYRHGVLLHRLFLADYGVRRTAIGRLLPVGRVSPDRGHLQKV